MLEEEMSRKKLNAKTDKYFTNIKILAKKYV